LWTGTHTFRHTAVTIIADEAGSTKTAFDFSGHKDPRTTARYMHKNSSNLKDMVNETSLSTIFLANFDR
jgi:integrase